MDLEWSSGCGVQILARKKDCNIATTEVEADLGEESLKRALFQKTSTLSNTQTAWNAIGSWGETLVGSSSATAWPQWPSDIRPGESFCTGPPQAVCICTIWPFAASRRNPLALIAGPRPNVCLPNTFQPWNPVFYPSFNIHY